MKTVFKIGLALAIFLTSCYKVPVSGRRQLNLLPESQLMGMSKTQYSQFLSGNKTVGVSPPDANQEMVVRVGKKIQAAVERYMHSIHQSKKIADYKWEFNLVKDDLINAWCMPGGKVVVYTGILPVTKTEEGLAVVMGHEVAHAIARHGNERMSQGLAQQVGGLALTVALSQKPQQTQNMFMQAYGVGSQAGMLKFSRTHESEADKLGLVFMAMAGYNPDEAVNFWGRMETATGGAQQPEFLSTHPHPKTRIEDIQAFLPEARNYYNKARR